MILFARTHLGTSPKINDILNYLTTTCIFWRNMQLKMQTYVCQTFVANNAHLDLIFIGHFRDDKSTELRLMAYFF